MRRSVKGEVVASVRLTEAHAADIFRCGRNGDRQKPSVWLNRAKML